MKFVLLYLSLFSYSFAQDDIATAFKREYAYLNAQKQELLRLKKKIESGQDSLYRRTQKKTEKLEGEYLNLVAKNESLAGVLSSLETSFSLLNEKKESLNSLLFQAKTTFNDLGKSFNFSAENEGKSTPLKAALAQMNETLKNLGQYQKETSEFFLADGTLVKGEVLKIGKISSIGKFQNNTFFLAPAGDAKLKALEKIDDDFFKNPSLRKQQKLFLYESLVNPYEPDKSKSVFEYISAGGAIAWVIVLLGLTSLALVVYRFINLRKAIKGEEGSLARVESITRDSLGKSKDQFEDLISEQVSLENSRLDRFSTILVVFAAITPLLGLLGTVTGMIGTFDVITKYGTSDPKLLSGGISEALITTELGLIVAIPVVLLGNVLNGQANQVKDQMEQLVLGIINKENKN